MPSKPDPIPSPAPAPSHDPGDDPEPPVTPATKTSAKRLTFATPGKGPVIPPSITAPVVELGLPAATDNSKTLNCKGTPSNFRTYSIQDAEGNTQRAGVITLPDNSTISFLHGTAPVLMTSTAARLYTKSNRSKLSEEKKADLHRAMTTYKMLSTRDKFRVITESLETLELDHVHNLASQLTTLSNHLILYDMDDVFNILLFDVTGCPTKTVDLFQSYLILDPDDVAASNAFYQLCSTEPYQQENLVLSFKLLENNTESHLWKECLDTYDLFEPAQKGGPLMLILMLQRIQLGTRPAMEHIEQQFRDLKLTDFDGEDVLMYAQTTTAVHGMIDGCSSITGITVPSDFDRVVLTTLQTSSCDEFTHIFRHIQLQTTAVASQQSTYGRRLQEPVYPPYNGVLVTAKSTYLRLKREGKWTGASHKSEKAAGFNAQTQSTKTKPAALSTQMPPAGGTSQSRSKCFNCGSEDHRLPDCPKPHDENKIKRAREAFFENKQRRTNVKTRTTRIFRGQPQILNVNKKWVPDTKALLALKAAAEKETKETKTETPSTATTTDNKLLETLSRALISVTKPPPVPPDATPTTGTQSETSTLTDTSSAKGYHEAALRLKDALSGALSL